MSQPRVLIIDSSYLIFRSYHVHKNLSIAGNPAGAFFGFARTVLSLLEELKPQILVFAADTPQKTQKHEFFEDYKAGRPELDQALKVQFPIILDWASQITPNFFRIAGFEADDIIAQMACQHFSGWQKMIFSADRDLFSLIDQEDTYIIQGLSKSHTKSASKSISKTASNSLLQKTSNSEQLDKNSESKNSGFDSFENEAKNKSYYTKTTKSYQFFGRNEFQEKYQLRPDQWNDYKILVGDGSDNLRGVVGVGPKGATTFLQEFGSIQEFEDLLVLISQMDESEFESFKSEQELASKISDAELSAQNLSQPRNKPFCENILPVGSSKYTNSDLQKIQNPPSHLSSNVSKSELSGASLSVESNNLSSFNLSNFGNNQTQAEKTQKLGSDSPEQNQENAYLQKSEAGSTGNYLKDSSFLLNSEVPKESKKGLVNPDRAYSFLKSCKSGKVAQKIWESLDDVDFMRAMIHFVEVPFLQPVFSSWQLALGMDKIQEYKFSSLYGTCRRLDLESWKEHTQVSSLQKDKIGFDQGLFQEENSSVLAIKNQENNQENIQENTSEDNLIVLEELTNKESANPSSSILDETETEKPTEDFKNIFSQESTEEESGQHSEYKTHDDKSGESKENHQKTKDNVTTEEGLAKKQSQKISSKSSTAQEKSDHLVSILKPLSTSPAENTSQTETGMLF